MIPVTARWQEELYMESHIIRLLFCYRVMSMCKERNIPGSMWFNLVYRLMLVVGLITVIIKRMGNND